VDGSNLNKDGYESMFIHPPFKKGGPSFLKGGWKGGKGGCRFVKYTLAEFLSLFEN